MQFSYGEKMDYAKEVEFIVDNMIKAFSLFSGDKKSTEMKATFDIVTKVDKEIEEYLTEQIKKEFPTDQVLGEEFSSSTLPTRRCWTIDPIDGTFNFAYGVPLFGVQCSLIDREEMVLGVIYLPFFNKIYQAEKGKGAYCNGEKLSVDKTAKCESAVVSIGDFSRKKQGELAEKQHKMLKKLYQNVAKVRMFGAACFDFAFLAEGKTHGTTLITRNLWDLVPGAVITREAGGIVTDLEGKPYTVNSEGIISACNSEISAQMIKAYREN